MGYITTGESITSVETPIDSFGRQHLPLAQPRCGFRPGTWCMKSKLGVNEPMALVSNWWSLVNIVHCSIILFPISTRAVSYMTACLRTLFLWYNHSHFVAHSTSHSFGPLITPTQITVWIRCNRYEVVMHRSGNCVELDGRPSMPCHPPAAAASPVPGGHLGKSSRLTEFLVTVVLVCLDCHCVSSG
jgi:hypothetical protein